MRRRRKQPEPVIMVGVGWALMAWAQACSDYGLPVSGPPPSNYIDRHTRRRAHPGQAIGRYWWLYEDAERELFGEWTAHYRLVKRATPKVPR